MTRVKYPYQMSIAELEQNGLSEEQAKRYKQIVRDYREAKNLFEMLSSEKAMLEASIKVERKRTISKREQMLIRIEEMLIARGYEGYNRGEKR